MKFLGKKLFFIFFWLILSNISHSSEISDIKNLVITEVPEKLKNVSFTNEINENISTEDLRGKVIIINFWAIWCKPCREEMASLDSLAENGLFKNLVIFPINVGSDTVEKSKKFYNEIKIKNLSLFFDKNLKLAKQFSLRGIPTSILINKNGEEFARVVGSIDFNDKAFVSWLQKYD